jgi:hypothetical protein
MKPRMAYGAADDKIIPRLSDYNKDQHVKPYVYEQDLATLKQLKRRTEQRTTLAEGGAS